MPFWNSFLDEDVSFTPPLGGGGTYYIKVTADHSISYRLVITRGASFDAKTNGAFSTAQDITGTSGALGDLASGTQDWYRISLPGLQSLEAEAIPPLDGANQPLNGLYPILQLYSASDMHTALASAALLPDGRSQFLRYSGLTASSSYYLKVSSTATAGEYFLGMVVNPPLEITTPSLSSSLLQSAFNQTIQTFGGTGTLTFSTSGNVPSWLSVTTSGVLEGTPTGTGSSTFTVTVTDATNQSCSRSYTVNIVDPTSPSGNYLPSTASANVLQVTSFYSSPSGFSVQFNGPFLVAPTTPVLYSTGYGTSARKASVLLTQGTIASGTAVLGTGSSAGKVVSVMIPTGEGGSLYGDPAYDPNSYVLFVAGGGSGATGVANVTSGQVTSVTINSGGGGYMSAPTVSFTGGGGSGATGIATINANWQVTGVTITNFGSGYTSTPTVVFSPGSGSGAAGAVNVSSGHITSVTITNEGSGYTSPPSIIFSVPDPVEGSLVLDPVNNTLTFVETDTASQVNNGTPILPDGKYTAIIRGIAATDGLQAGWNNAYLDGLGTGFAGSGDFTATFTINGAQDDIVWVPATGDGPGQALNAPGGNAANGGYPVYINDNTGAVTSVELTLNYNPALLTINEVPGQSVNNPALPGSSFQLVSNDNGVAVFKYTDTGGNNASHLKGVKKILGYILASVPSGTAASPMFYGSTEILHLSNVSINGSTNGVASADAVHLVAYVGDADDAIHILGYIGTAWLTGIYGDNTTQLIINTMLNENTGFAAYALVDPVIIADTDGVGYIPSDAALQIEELLGGFPSLLGAIPTGPYIVF